MAIRADLEAVGITVTPVAEAVEPGLPRRRSRAAPSHGMHLLGWTGDYNDTDNFIGVFFGAASAEWGFDNPRAVRRARPRPGADPPTRQQSRRTRTINRSVMEFLPGRPAGPPDAVARLQPAASRTTRQPGAGRGLDTRRESAGRALDRGVPAPARPDRLRDRATCRCCAFVLRRLALLVPVLFGLSVLLFLWVRALPGGPAAALLGERATPEARRADQPSSTASTGRCSSSTSTYIGRAAAAATSASRPSTGEPVLDEFLQPVPGDHRARRSPR